MKIKSFIDDLAKTAVPFHTANPYAYPNQRKNLNTYLQRMADLQPRFMLVGEAPGYRGARLTGIPFASPDTLAQLSQQLGISTLIRPDEWPHIQKEASATIMWQTLAQVTAVPLIWNAFPFHPHQSHNPQSNRKPATKEVALGRPFLQELCNLFTIHTIIAVGNTAAHALAQWGVSHEKVRHPSHGGKQQFQAGLLDLLNP